jgi:hypothetical protein
MVSNVPSVVVTFELRTLNLEPISLEMENSDLELAEAEDVKDQSSP